MIALFCVRDGSSLKSHSDRGTGTEGLESEQGIFGKRRKDERRVVVTTDHGRRMKHKDQRKGIGDRGRLVT